MAGCRTFLDISMGPAMRQVVLVDGRVVLGIEKWRRIMVRHGLGMTQAAFVGLLTDGIIQRERPEPPALLVIAVLDEIAINSAFAADSEAARATFGAVIERMLTGLRAGCEAIVRRP